MEHAAGGCRRGRGGPTRLGGRSRDDAQAAQLRAGAAAGLAGGRGGGGGHGEGGGGGRVARAARRGRRRGAVARERGPGALERGGDGEVIGRRLVHRREVAEQEEQLHRVGRAQ